MQYYITEQIGNREQLTQSSTLQRSETDGEPGDWRFSLLNRAVSDREAQDYENCATALTDYMKKDFMIREIFGSH